MPDPMEFKVSASGFVALPNALMKEAPDFRIWGIYAAVRLHGYGSEQGCWISVATLMKETNAGRRTVQHALAWLRENGWLVAEERPGSTTVYRVLAEKPQGQPGSNLNPVQKCTPFKNEWGPRSKMNGVPGSKMNHELEPLKQEPINKNPNKGADQKKDPFRLKHLPSHAVPDDLAACGDLLAEFWGCKKGTRSERVFNRICNKLRQWTPEQRQEALERAISAGWGDVFQPSPQRAHSAATATMREWTPEQWKALDDVHLF